MQIPFEAHSVLRCNDDPLYTVTSRRPSPDHLHAWPLSRQYFPIRQRINLTDAMRSNRVPLLKALVPRNDGCEVDEKTKTYGEASVSSFPCAWHDGVAHHIPIPPVSALLLIHLRLPDLFWLKLYYSVASQNPIIQINFILLFSRDICRGTGSIPTVPVCPLAKRVLPDKGDAKRMFNYFRSCFRLSLERCLLSKNGGSIQH